MTLTEFLLDRIAEDEGGASNWSRFEIRDGIPGAYGIRERVLAECEAKRRIVEEHAEVTESRPEYYPRRIVTTTGCGNCRGYGQGEEYIIDGPCQTLRLLALPYADDPAYNRAWIPTDSLPE